MSASSRVLVAVDIPSGADADAMGEQGGNDRARRRHPDFYRAASGTYFLQASPRSHGSRTDRFRRKRPSFPRSQLHVITAEDIAS